MILKFSGKLSFSTPATDAGGSSKRGGENPSKCYIGGRPLVETVVDAEPEGIVTVAFPGYRFHGEIACPTASAYAERPEERLGVNDEDVLAALRQYEGQRIWFWLADKPLSAMQLTVIGAQYAGADPRPLDLEDANVPRVESDDWEYAYQCFAEALLLERNDAQLIGLFVSSVLATDRWSEYGIVMLIQMLNRAIELEPDDSVLLHTRATLLDAVGEKDRAAIDRERIKEMRRAEMQKFAEHAMLAMENSPNRRDQESIIASGDISDGY